MARALLPWVAALAAAVAVFGMPAQSGHDLFQQALVKERAEGNLQEAIDLYDRIVRDFSADHALAAKALVQMGQCYEKLGKAEAKKVYERVIRDYADQAEPLQVARTRLAALAQPLRHEMAVRRIWSDPTTDTSGEISPDGRYLSFVDWETGDLAVRDQATGKSRRLTDEGSLQDPSRFALYSRWSPDGRQIAYDWYSPSGPFSSNEVRVLALKGGRPRVLYKGEEKTSVLTADWSPDGREILVIIHSTGPSGSSRTPISAIRRTGLPRSPRTDGTSCTPVPRGKAACRATSSSSPRMGRARPASWITRPTTWPQGGVRTASGSCSSAIAPGASICGCFPLRAGRRLERRGS
jgi:hypothetical protein